MRKKYSLFSKNMTLRDHLALDRTVLANERTLLAYLRTFIGFLAAGIAALKLLGGTPAIHVLGWLMIVASPLFLALGIMRYTMVRKKLSVLKRTVQSGQDVGQDVKQTAIHVSRSVAPSEPPHQTEETFPKQS